MKLTKDFYIGFLVCLLICVGVYFQFFKSKELPIEINEKETIIDSLNVALKVVQLQRDSAYKKAIKSDSIASASVMLLNKKFNTDEKNKIFNSVVLLDDSASFVYFSKWLSEADSIAR